MQVQTGHGKPKEPGRMTPSGVGEETQSLLIPTPAAKKRFVEEQSADLPRWLEWARYLGNLLSPAWFIVLLTLLVCYLLGHPQTIEALQTIQQDEELKKSSGWAVGLYAFTAGYFTMALLSVAYPGNRPPEAVARDDEAARTAGRWWIVCAVIVITVAVPLRLVWIGYANGMPSLANDAWLALGA